MRHWRGKPCVSMSIGFLIASGRGPRAALLPAPLGDASVVAGKEHLRDAPAAELGRPRVVRVLEAAVELGGERLLEPGLVAAECAWKPARDCVEDDHRRQLAAREDVGANRDAVRGEMLDDPLVEAFEASGEERQLVLRREL